MAAYVIFIRDGAVRDQAEFAQYSKTAREARGDFKLTPLAVYGAVETLEGAPADGVVVLQFPDAEQAKRWYNSEAYQAALPHRMRAASYRVVITEGL
ncbi:DUF1330 domain-containing protein [Phenylobacterium sp.]|jgi:uncharacterized protein (DUF1330 family)|uniref:DUF1330 domain-containing protein n=1 Tax=Phenylobacterium sp. TaxID=1871053 RepID=UPI002F3E2CF0